MADNISILDKDAAAKVVAADDVSSVFYQVMKLALGADGAVDCLLDSGQQAMASSLPVAIASDQGSLKVAGPDAADAAVAGNPLLAGAKASAAAPSAMSTDGDLVALWADLYGRLKVANRAAQKTPVNAKVAYSASQTAATVYTPTSGKKLLCTHIVISASAAGVVYLFDNSDSSANSWSPSLTLAANGGWEAHFSDENPLIMGATDNVLKYTSGSGAAGSIWIHGWEE